MTATYDPSLATARDWLRFRLQDTIVSPETAALLSDEELDALLTAHDDDVSLAGGDAARVLAARFRGMADLSVGDTSISFGERAAAFDALAVQFQGQVVAIPFTGGVSRSDVRNRNDTTDRVVPFFQRDTRTVIADDWGR